MKSFFTEGTQGTNRTCARTDDSADASAGAGAGGAGAADSAALRAHGYEVKSDVIVWMIAVTHGSRFSRCGKSFHLIIWCADAHSPDAISHPHCASIVRPEQGTHREESS
jgi:hypothetical protein